MQDKTREILNQILVWQYRHKDGVVRPYSGYLQKRFGNQYAVHMRYLEENGLITCVESEQFFLGTTKKGRTRGYLVSKDAGRKAKKIVTSQDSEYFKTHARTNISTGPYIANGQDRDTRDYTDFAAMPSKLRAQVTIDDEVIASVDIANCFIMAALDDLPPFSWTRG